MTNEEIDAKLLSLADAEYKEFNAKIVNSNLKMLGVRAPQLKELAKVIAREPENFFDSYKLENYEQILLYSLAFSFAKQMPIEEKFARLDKVLPLFDNWAHVDMTVGAFKELGKYRDLFLSRYARLVEAPEYERRFMVVFLMSYCLTPEYLPTVFGLYEKMQCDKYYVNMGIAWGLSVALVKFYDETFAFLERGTFNNFIVRKTVQKARESFRIPPERKAELKSRFFPVLPRA
ncbi:MAG: DNA alkylation repair protein [Clostridia bacterium]|jgi:3-methyladenine DNA glycosylase AlkD|nr:DNA alkylation repair protein [Clostridia bacterium]